MVKQLAAAAAASISAAPSSLPPAAPFHFIYCSVPKKEAEAAFKSKSVKVLSGKYAMLMHRRYKCEGSMPFVTPLDYII